MILEMGANVHVCLFPAESRQNCQFRGPGLSYILDSKHLEFVV